MRPHTRTERRPASRGIVLVGLASASIFASAGCTVVRPVVEPSELRVMEQTDETTRVGVVVDLLNTGRNEVELVRYEYTVVLEDGARYDGVWSAQRALPPGRTVTAVIPAVLPTESVGRGAAAIGRGWRLEGKLRYRDPQAIARILYEAGILRTEVGFSGSGTIASPIASPIAADAPAG